MYHIFLNVTQCNKILFTYVTNFKINYILEDEQVLE
jgi:hypothetical protein